MTFLIILLYWRLDTQWFLNTLNPPPSQSVHIHLFIAPDVVFGHIYKVTFLQLTTNEMYSSQGLIYSEKQQNSKRA